MKKVAIVGGGIGGLTAAALLEQQGMAVTLYERSEQLGGRMAFEEEGPYRIDQGPTIVLLPEMLYSILEEAGIARDQLELLPCDPMYKIHYDSGSVFTKWTDRTAQRAEIERTFPGEGEGFMRFMSVMDQLYPAGQKGFLEQSFLNKRSFYTPRLLTLLARMKAHKSLRAVMGDYFANEELKDAYSLQSLYIGGNPRRTPGIYSLLPYAEHQYGVWMVKGGYGQLPRLLAGELKRRGVQLHLQTEVEGIVVEQGRVKGVKVRGQQEDFDAVLYNGEFPLLEALLTGKNKPRKSKSFKPSSGCVLIYLGVKKRWEQAAVHQFFLPPSLMSSLDEVFAKRSIPSQPSFYIFNPVSIDPEAAPADESVLYVLIPVPDAQGVDWEQITSPLVEKVLDEAQRRGYDGLREHIVWQKVRTPQDAARDGLFGGGSFGIAPILSQSGVYRPQPKPYPAIAGLYAAGASVHPGGGVPIVMQGARLAVQELLKEMSS